MVSYLCCTNSKVRPRPKHEVDCHHNHFAHIQEAAWRSSTVAVVHWSQCPSKAKSGAWNCSIWMCPVANRTPDAKHLEFENKKGRTLLLQQERHLHLSCCIISHLVLHISISWTWRLDSVSQVADTRNAHTSSRRSANWKNKPSATAFGQRFPQGVFSAQTASTSDQTGCLQVSRSLDSLLQAHLPADPTFLKVAHEL